MCILEVFTDVYPNNAERRHETLLICENGSENRPCARLFPYEHTPRLLAYPEAPPALLTAREGRSVAPSTSTTSTTSSKRKGRRYWKRGEQVVVEIDIPLLGRKKKKDREYVVREEDVIVVPERGQGQGQGQGQGHGHGHGHDHGHVHGHDPAIPIPPPAPMPPRRHPGPHWAQVEDDVVVVPPPPYRDRRERRRSSAGAPLIVQVSPPSSPPLSPRRVVAPEREQPVEFERGPSPPLSPQGAGDDILRRQVDRERQALRQARRAEEARRRADEERHNAEEERRQADRDRRRANEQTERAQQQLERERVRRRNAEQERAQLARDRERQAERERRDSFQRDRDALADALLAGRRVAQPMRPTVVRGGPREAHDSGEESWTSAPGDIRVVSRPRRGQGLREHGHRVLEAAGLRWTEAEDRRVRGEERRRREMEGNLGRRAHRHERVVWDDERQQDDRWR